MNVKKKMKLTSVDARSMVEKKKDSRKEVILKKRSEE